MKLSRLTFVGAAAATIAAGALAGCNGASDGDSTPGDTFIAFATNFYGYRTWTKSVVEDTGATPASTHLSGTRIVYVNQVPPSGSAEFPVGTIIVKELGEGAIGDRQVFAMVKRGGGYNQNGATNWEWFELQNIDEEKVKIVWHGVGPPAGEKYGGDPNGGCNGCHGGAADNDFVQTPALDLASF